jgi:hypothetical protein
MEASSLSRARIDSGGGPTPAARVERGRGGRGRRQNFLPTVMP